MSSCTSSRLIIVTFLLGTAFLIPQAQAADVPQSFTLDGKLFSDAAGTTPLQDSSIAFTVQIVDEAKTCVVYEEAQTLNTVASKGYFTMQVGTEVGSPLRTAGDSANSMSHVFQNIATINGKLLANGAPCTVPPVAAKRRFVRIKILPSTMGGLARTLSPDLSIDSVPNAIIAERAESLQGLRADNVLQVNTSGTNQLSQTNLESLFTSTARFNSLTSIVDGTSTSYMRSNSASGAQLPVTVGAPTGPSPGSIWYDSADSKLKYQTSVGPVIVGSGSGTVTSVGFTAPSELSVANSPVTSSGTIAVTWATQTANKVFASPDAATGTPTFRTLVASDIPSLPWTKITSLLPTTLLGYGITDAVKNAGGTPSLESGLNAAKGAATTAGRIWISTDTKEIYRDNGTTWDLIGSAATGTGDFLANGTIPMTGTLKMGGNTIYGNSTSGGNLTLESTSNATKGHLILQPTSGNVGIGTTTPSVNLHVSRAGGTGLTNPASLYLTNSTSQGSAEFLMGESGGTDGVKMRYNSSADGAYNALEFLGYTGSADTAVHMMIDRSGGSVGIGTISPEGKLTVAGAAANSKVTVRAISGSYDPYINFDTGSTFNEWSVGLDDTADSSSAKFTIAQADGVRSNSRLTIDATGNVGIGTTSPNQLLTVEGPMSLRTQAAPTATANYGKIYVDSGDSNKLKYMNPAGTIADLSGATSAVSGTSGRIPKFASASTLGDSIIREASGKIGVGVAPIGWLSANSVTVDGDVAAGNAAVIIGNSGVWMNGGNDQSMWWNNDLWIGNDAVTGTDLVIGTNSLERFRVMQNGNVGIGTAAPDTKLDVNGAVAVSASIESASAYVSSGTAYSIPDSTVNIRRITLDNNTTLTLPTFTTPTAKVWTLTVMVKQDATGGRTLAWAASGGASILWDQSATAPAPASGAGKITIYQFTKPSDETTWYGSMVWKQN